MTDKEKLIELLEVDLSGSDGYEPELIADHLIANGVTVQEWISVKDRTPTEKGCYMVTVKHWLDGKPVVREAKWNGVDWLSCYKAEELTPRVTNWQYLPQPPKGE